MRTALYDRHVALGAKIIDFCGWEMPIQYKGILHEHQVVRQAIGIFDVSHMGRVLVEGPEAEKFVDFLATNVIAGKKDFAAIYTVFANEEGGSIDDAIVYRYNAEKCAVVVNACNRDKDLKHLQMLSAGFDVTVTDQYQDNGILAVQGPQAGAVVSRLFPEAASIRPMRFCEVDFNGESILLASTGYTGSGGYEISGSDRATVALWDRILEEGQPEGIEPVGLGARDTLRLEAGFALYGHELTDSIAPIESISSWTVKMNKPDFVGKAALEQMVRGGQQRYQYGAVLLDRGIARQGYPVFRDGYEIGEVTSGGHAPALDKAIAIVLVEDMLNEGDVVEVQIRTKPVKAEIAKLPFFKA